MHPTTSRLARAAIVLAVGLALASPVGAASAGIRPVPSPDPSVDARTHLAEFANRVVADINGARLAHDLRPVRYYDPCIDRFSEKWGRHLARTGRFEHRDQMPILETCNLSWVGEALVRGTGISPAHMVRAWLESPEHRAILLKPRANRVGISVRLDPQGRFLGVLNFGDSR